MITCTQNTDGTFNLAGLTIEDLEMLQESYALLFGECRKEEFRHIRHQVVIIDKAIDPILEKYQNLQEDE